MKIIVPAIGSRGEVQPYINLFQSLQEVEYQSINLKGAYRGKHQENINAL